MSKQQSETTTELKEKPNGKSRKAAKAAIEASVSSPKKSGANQAAAMGEVPADDVIDILRDPLLDTREGPEPSDWEKRLEAQVNTFFDEAINRIPGFVDRHLTSFRRIMTRNLSPKTGLADMLIGVRNMAAGASKVVGGPDFSTTSYTHDQLMKSFQREVVSSEELESLLRRLFSEFEEDQWRALGQEQISEGKKAKSDGLDHYPSRRERNIIEDLRSEVVERMEKEIGHDPLLAQAIRAGVRIGLPATLGYVLFGKVTFFGQFGAESAGELYKRNLNFYHRLLLRLGRFEAPQWLGAVGWAGGLLGSMAVGGVMEYAINNIRDIKGAYIRQLNNARYVLLYGEDPSKPEGQGLMHILRGLERQFERVSDYSQNILSDSPTAG